MAETVTIEKLREAVHNVDAMSQEGFREIKAVARLTMFALMTPEGQRDTEAIANALQAIWNRAEQSESAINWEAEQVGLQYTDVDMVRRYEAGRAIKAGRAAEGMSQ
ncbi:hypothetical protein HF908_04970 [Ralstonia pseudosolanacearum]|uniref:hypothetical protein n=1 Tax=Ralstonia pseudosolanacearum TaxID=1310165 RepID=UPI0018682730|nr:hypothetical protein [Ralstonia pseudosolanacearum]QOK90889.1 hypothetical protein HF908_04970 [Ralstonia pseudosolanacearum]